MIVRGLLAPRAALTEGRERRVDQLRIDLAQIFVAEAQRLERTGPVVLHQHVGGGDQFLQDLAALLGLQVQRDGALVGTLRQEAGAHVGVVQHVVAAGIAALIRVVRMLDLDHVGAHQPKLIGRERPGQHVRDVDDADAFERTRHARLPWVLWIGITVQPCPHGVNTLGWRERGGGKRRCRWI